MKFIITFNKITNRVETMTQADIKGVEDIKIVRLLPPLVEKEGYRPYLFKNSIGDLEWGYDKLSDEQMEVMQNAKEEIIQA